jgi:hypothetical protein
LFTAAGDLRSICSEIAAKLGGCQVGDLKLVHLGTLDHGIIPKRFPDKVKGCFTGINTIGPESLGLQDLQVPSGAATYIQSMSEGKLILSNECFE